MAKFNVAVSNNQAFGNLAIHGYQFFDSETINAFTQCFEEVKPNKAAVREEFDIYASDLGNLNFFETKTTYPLPTPTSAPTAQIAQDCRKALKPIYMSNPYKDTSDFLVCLPLTEAPYVPFNEVAAIYAIMYYLGSLIRYYPRYLEKLLHSKDAWIIERFCEGSPSTFLRHISNLILNEDRVYVRR